MAGNPYAEVHRLERLRAGRRHAWLAPVLGAAVAAPLARPALLGFLDVGLPPSGVAGAAFRVGAAVAAVVLLAGYSELVRGPDRAVLDAHPVQAPALVRALGARLARRTAPLAAAGVVLLAPLLVAGHAAAFAGAAALALGGWACALGIGFAVDLGAVWVALDPRAARVLDLLRGENPRMHAALIYAPGAGLALAGLLVGLGASGLSAALGGWAPGWAFLALPPAGGLLGRLLWSRLADRLYVRATAVVVEVDSAWAAVESPDEARRVYLDWLAGDRPELLRALRQGWRARRTWATGAWAIGGLGLLAGWSDAPEATGRALAVAGAGALLVAALPTRLAEGDPEWLDRALGVQPGPVAAARAATAFLYAQAAVLPAAAALLVRQGAGPALFLLGAAELLAALGAGSAALAAARWRGRGLLLYGPAALVLWAAVAGAGAG